MASTAPATNILNGYPIRNYDTTDPGATAWANDIKGGHHQYQTTIQRDAITTERRAAGMTCYVVDTGITYVLGVSLANEDWVDQQALVNTRVDGLESSIIGKAATNLTNAISESVVNRLIGAESVTLDKLDPTLRATIGSGLDATLFQSNWDASTDTPTIPVPTGNNGKWYYVNVAGVATGNAAGTYGVGDRIVSNGTSWQKLTAPPTNIPDGSLTMRAFSENVVRNDAVLANGQNIARGWSTADGTENILSFDEFGKLTPDPAAEVTERVDAMEDDVEALSGYLDPGGIPVDRIANVEVWEDGAWILHEGEHVQLIRALLTEDGTELIAGVSSDGTYYPIQAGGGGGGGFTPPDYVVFPQDAGGLGVSDDAGERAVITEDATWKDMQPTDTEDVWIGRSNRLTGVYGLHTVNIITKTTVPANTSLLFGVGVTGQSLAAGGSGVPLLTTAPIHPANNFMFNGGLDAGTNGVVINTSEMASLVAMYQTLQHGQSYEMPIPGYMNRLNSKLLEAVGSRVKLLCADHAWGGKAYVDIKQGTAAYNNGLYEVTRGKSLAESNGWTYNYLATILIHGEQDTVINTPAATYDGYLKELLADETTDIQAITGQISGHLIFTDQVHSWTAYGDATPTVPLGQLSAALTEPRIIMVCPKYFFTYVDGIHMVGQSYRRLGEYHAKAQYAVFFQGKTWNPFSPIEVGQTASTVWARFQSPLGHSIRFDTTLVSDPGNYGFELVGGTISGTPVVTGDMVTIPKTGAATTELRYAYTGTPGQWAGPTTGARGCLRDTDPAVSDFDGTHLYNYCCTFSVGVPPAP